MPAKMKLFPIGNYIKDGYEKNRQALKTCIEHGDILLTRAGRWSLCRIWLKHNMSHFLHLFVHNKTNNDILKITSRSYCSWKITEYSISWKLTFEPFAMKYWAFCWTLHFVIYWSLSNLKQGTKFIASHENLTKMPNVDQRISDLSVWLYFASMCSPYI